MLVKIKEEFKNFYNYYILKEDIDSDFLIGDSIPEEPSVIRIIGNTGNKYFINSSRLIPISEDPNKELQYSKEHNEILKKLDMGSRFNSNKPQWHLIDMDSLEGMVRVLEFGKNKYSENNWKKGLPILDILDSLLRHTYAYMNGQDLDPESGLPHIDHIGCNYLFLSYMSINRPDLDNRYKKDIDEKEK